MEPWRRTLLARLAKEDIAAADFKRKSTNYSFSYIKLRHSVI